MRILDSPPTTRFHNLECIRRHAVVKNEKTSSLQEDQNCRCFQFKPIFDDRNDASSSLERTPKKNVSTRPRRSSRFSHTRKNRKFDASGVCLARRPETCRGQFKSSLGILFCGSLHHSILLSL